MDTNKLLNLAAKKGMLEKLTKGLMTTCIKQSPKKPTMGGLNECHNPFTQGISLAHH